MGLLKAKKFRAGLLFVTKEDLGNAKIIALDADNTSSYDLTTEPIPGAKEWVEARKSEGFKVVLLSNAKASRAKILSEQYGIDAIGFSAKPFPIGGIRLVLKYRVKPSNVVMIGDQLLTDIIGGNLMGFDTIYTKPYEKEKNRGKVFFFKRKIERIVFKLQGVEI